MIDKSMVTQWIAWLVPVIASWLVSQWNTATTWLRPKANWIKVTVYIGAVIIGMGLLAAVKWASGMVPPDWSDVFWNAFVGGIAGTLIYKIGRNDAKANPAA